MTLTSEERQIIAAILQLIIYHYEQHSEERRRKSHIKMSKWQIMYTNATCTLTLHVH